MCAAFCCSEDAAQRLSELWAEAGSDATWHENILEELQDHEDVKAAEAVMQRIREGSESATDRKAAILAQWDDGASGVRWL